MLEYNQFEHLPNRPEFSRPDFKSIFPFLSTLLFQQSWVRYEFEYDVKMLGLLLLLEEQNMFVDWHFFYVD